MEWSRSRARFPAALPADAAAARRIYRKAKAAGVGRAIPTEWFLQDILTSSVNGAGASA
jgi:hypothetical protein